MDRLQRQRQQRLVLYAQGPRRWRDRLRRQRHSHRAWRLPRGSERSGFYEEILNTDAETYGGSNVGNWGGREAEHWAWQVNPTRCSSTFLRYRFQGFKKSSPRE